MRAQYILGVTIRPRITIADLYGKGYICEELGDVMTTIVIWCKGNGIGRACSAGKADHWKGNGNPAFFLHHIIGESLSYFHLRNAASKMVLGTGEIM